MCLMQDFLFERVFARKVRDSNWKGYREGNLFILSFLFVVNIV